MRTGQKYRLWEKAFSLSSYTRRIRWTVKRSLSAGLLTWYPEIKLPIVPYSRRTSWDYLTKRQGGVVTPWKFNILKIWMIPKSGRGDLRLLQVLCTSKNITNIFTKLVLQLLQSFRRAFFSFSDFYLCFKCDLGERSSLVSSNLPNLGKI